MVECFGVLVVVCGFSGLEFFLDFGILVVWCFGVLRF